MKKNHFQWTKESPYHISVGAVVKNNKGEICCHYFNKFSHPAVGSFEDFYLLMRESLEDDETLEQCLERGLKEEFGIVAEPLSFLGSIVSHLPMVGSNALMEKTTLYFLCDFISIDETLRSKNDPETASQIKWLPRDELISKMKEQVKRFKREDADESIVLERISAIGKV
jgi:NADH pyrophosphatase NudC (nudix superfamily)